MRGRVVNKIVNWDKLKGDVETYVQDIVDDFNLSGHPHLVSIQDTSRFSVNYAFLRRLDNGINDYFSKGYKHMLKKIKHIQICGEFEIDDQDPKALKNKETLNNLLFRLNPYIEELLDRLIGDGFLPFSYFKVEFLKRRLDEKISVSFFINCYMPNTEKLRNNMCNLHTVYMSKYDNNPLNNTDVTGYQPTKLKKFGTGIKNFTKYIFTEYDPDISDSNFSVMDKFPIRK